MLISRGRYEPSDPLDVESTSLTLLARVRANDEQAWARFTQLYGPLVYDWCRRYGLSPSDAADVGQEVFLRVLKNLDRFQKTSNHDTLRGWLRTITKRLCLDLWRKQNNEPQPMSLLPNVAGEWTVDTAETASGEELVSEKRILYQRALDLLRNEFTPTTIDAFWKTVVEDKPIQEVATLLGISANSVYIARSRVLSRLRRELAD